jgi:hypothetical protein
VDARHVETAVRVLRAKFELRLFGNLSSAERIDVTAVAAEMARTSDELALRSCCASCLQAIEMTLHGERVGTAAALVGAANFGLAEVPRRWRPCSVSVRSARAVWDRPWLLP